MILDPYLLIPSFLLKTEKYYDLVGSLTYVITISLAYFAVENKTTIQILSNVLLEAKQGRLHLSATDMDITISDKVKVKNIESDGGTSVPAHILYNVIKELSDDKSVNLIIKTRICFL